MTILQDGSCRLAGHFSLVLPSSCTLVLADDICSFFAGETCELYHCVLESKSFLEKMTVLEHTIPFFLPIREAENDLLTSNAKVRSDSCIGFAGTILKLFLNIVPYDLLSEIHRLCWRSFAGLCG